ncbi:hypothetical protein C8J56DRAFT_858082 [Mycena floridula]|nr:hypothetical protein C8J56DRAFT_858082 [Mycena floridula]
MNISHPLSSSVTKISFSFLTSEEIRRISVKRITNPVLLDDLNRPNIGGLYDPSLGPSERQDICSTCHLTFFTCPGHFGHIELPAPVFHPLFISNMYNLLRATCLFCHKFKLNRAELYRYQARLMLLDHGLLNAALGVEDVTISVKKRKSKKLAKKGGKKKAEPESEADATEDEMEVDGEEDETLAEFEMRLNDYVQTHLRRASGSKRDHYKDGLVYQTRKDVINEFLKSTILVKCRNEDCGCPAYTFRKEGHSKIIEYDLSAKQKKQLLKKRPDVLLLDTSAEPIDEDIDMSGPESDEGEGDSLADDDEVDEIAKPNGVQLPRAANGKLKTSRGRNERVMPAEECRAHLRRLFKNDATMCSLIYGKHGPFAILSAGGLSVASADMFFMDVLAVPPTRFRPPAKLNDVLFEHPQNELLAKVLNTSYRLRDFNIELAAVSTKTADADPVKRRKLMSSLLEALIQLQVDVNSFMDSNKNPAPMRQGQVPPAGVKQGLEKKEGLFRKNMMGKRVNYAARSVISPDINIEPNEIGIPPVFARKLTFPEPVTAANFRELRQLVITGPHNWPGATMVENEDGHQVSLDKLTVEQRTAIASQLMTPQEETRSGVNRRGLFTRTAAVNKKVYRHLQNGDMLILNRQPTLHKPSMMCHKARVLLGEKTIRMHYANCNSYNADFDGDEMNVHFPQNQIARAEALLIANTDNQYLVPTSGNPLRGLIQDHVVAGVWMTSQDTFFTREEYFQLLYGALREDQNYEGVRFLTLPPTIWKPVPLWTGKQIISTVLKNITPEHLCGLNLTSKTKSPGHLWSYDPSNDKVVFMDGELMYGVLDKSAFGASEYGLVHSVYELYGAEIAGKLLGILSRLFTKYLQHRAFTCRMDDLTLTPEGNAKRRDVFQRGQNFGTDGAVENFPSLNGMSKEQIPEALTSLLQDVLRDDDKMASLDLTVKNKLSKLTKSVADECMPKHLSRKFPHNNMQTMTQSGAKGSAVNVNQISCALGQQELEGRRVPVMVSGKTLPSFKPFETKAMAGGYVASRFLTGIKPQEFYFHCMAGREGLIDTAVKTSRSGYLQRCLIKHLEGLRVHYDHTVRGSDSSIYQFHYGGDGLDVTRQKHLQQFDFIAANQKSFVRLYRPQDLSKMVDDDEAVRYMKKVVKRINSSSSKLRELAPALSLFSPCRNLGATSEQFAVAVDRYVAANPSGLLQPKKKKNVKEDDQEGYVVKRRIPLVNNVGFKLLMNLKYLRSLVDPGEAVGLLASQSIGEPSTQMTLNTFHFAGHGAANVTLGIPRLREIVMTASRKPKTPSMTMKVREGTLPEDIELFCKRASRLTLSQVVSEVAIVEQLIVQGDARRTNFTVRMTFFPQEEYESEYAADPWQILSCFATRFPLILKKEIASEMKKLDVDLKTQMAELGKGKRKDSKDAAPDADGDDEVDADPKQKRGGDEESEAGDGDADDEKRSRQRKEQASYSDDEDEEDEEEKSVADDAEQELVDETPPTPKKSKSFAKHVTRTSEMFQANLESCIEFDLDASGCVFKLTFSSRMPKLLLVGIIERTCRATIVREIPGITDCFPIKNEKTSAVSITTNGSNFRGMWEFAADSESILEDQETYSNDIYAVLMTYGVEMAREAILREMGGVFGVYSIQVDRRHLELIADYMTFDGGYRPFNRSGIAKNSSPLLKASYETTAAFLSDATLYGDFDDLTTPSGSIVLGRPNLTGTGVFDVVFDLNSKT